MVDGDVSRAADDSTIESRDVSGDSHVKEGAEVDTSIDQTGLKPNQTCAEDAASKTTSEHVPDPPHGDKSVATVADTSLKESSPRQAEESSITMETDTRERESPAPTHVPSLPLTSTPLTHTTTTQPDTPTQKKVAYYIMCSVIMKVCILHM